MEKLIDWIKSLGYDLFSILMPGAFFLVGFQVIVESMPSNYLRFPTIEFGVAFGLDPSVGSGFVGVSVVAIVFFTAAYVIGTVLKISSGFNPFKWFYTRKLSSFSVSNEVYNTAIERVKGKFNLEDIASMQDREEWRMFYMIVKVHLTENKIPTNIFNYQNKYEFCRTTSMATIFLLVLYTLGLIVGILKFNLAFWDAMFASLEFWFWIAFLMLLAGLLRSGFRRNWILMGDHVVFQALSIKSASNSS